MISIGGPNAQLGDIKSILKEKGSYEWVLILFFIFLIESWPGSKLDRFSDRIWYSMNYNTDWQNVDLQRRPSDCDFSHAPMGSKRCSYSKEKTVFDEVQRQKWLAQHQLKKKRTKSARDRTL